MAHDSDKTSFARLLAVVRELRARCPWDREQSLPSLAKHLIEEAYEAADAIARDAPRDIADELGDLITQGIFAAIVAEQDGRFTMAQLFDWAAEKLIRRHPHVYGNIKADSADEVVANWRLIKEQERKAAGAVSALDNVGRGLPALMRAEKLGVRARQAGMDWGDIHAVLAKVREEMDEVEGKLANNDPDGAAAELGDMLLALANAPRFVGHNAEETLGRASDKFIRRFRQLEKTAAARGLELTTLAPEEIEKLWQAAKVIELGDETD